MKTKSYKKFTELSEIAKREAIEENRYINIIGGRWHSDIHQKFKSEVSHFDVGEIYFAVDGYPISRAMFEYSDISTELFEQAIDKLKIVKWKKDFLKNNCMFYGEGKYKEVIKCEHKIEIEKPWGDYYPNIRDFIEECSQKVSEILIDEYDALAQKLLENLTAKYEHLTSDSSVEETLRHSRLKFSSNGSTLK